MKILGIDFGLINLGLAMSEGELVEPLTQLRVKNPEEAVAQLVPLCQKNKIKKIIIGLPEGKLVKTIKKFSRQLRQRTNLPIVFQEEDFTSQEASKKMLEAKKPLKKRQKQEHMMAACLILQSYLDEQVRTG
jgi:putative Holliday junction resolvase